MKNKTIESTIEQVVDAAPRSDDFKECFKQYVKNVFDDNATKNDLKHVLQLIEIDEEEELV